MQSTFIEQGGERWTLLAVARDAETAELWRESLEAFQIGAEIRIGDAAHLTTRSSVIIGANSPAGDMLFAYPIFVPAEQRERAAAVLIDNGWDGRFGSVNRAQGMDTTTLVRGTIAILAGSIILLTIVRVFSG